MGSSYSYDLDQSSLLKGFVNLKNASLIFLINLALLLLESIFILIDKSTGDDFWMIFSWVIDIMVVISGLIAGILFLLGINAVKSHLGSQMMKRMKALVVLLYIYIIGNTLSSIFTLLFHLSGELTNNTAGRNLIFCSIISIFLIILSFNFNNLQKVGYETKILYIPLMTLTIPSLVSFIAGITAFTALDYNHYFEPINVFYIVTFMLITILIFASFFELYIILRKMTILIDKKYVYKDPEETKPLSKAIPAKK